MANVLFSFAGYLATLA